MAFAMEKAAAAGQFARIQAALPAFDQAAADLQDTIAGSIAVQASTVVTR